MAECYLINVLADHWSFAELYRETLKYIWVITKYVIYMLSNSDHRPICCIYITPSDQICSSFKTLTMKNKFIMKSYMKEGFHYHNARLFELESVVYFREILLLPKRHIPRSLMTMRMSNVSVVNWSATYVFC